MKQYFIYDGDLMLVSMPTRNTAIYMACKFADIYQRPMIVTSEDQDADVSVYCPIERPKYGIN